MAKFRKSDTVLCISKDIQMSIMSCGAEASVCQYSLNGKLIKEIIINSDLKLIEKKLKKV
jgi:hypothetical protein